MGTRNETFAREMLEFARQYPHPGPYRNRHRRHRAGSDSPGIRSHQCSSNSRHSSRAIEDTHLALGIDLYNGTRGLYKAVKPIAEINGVQDVISRIGLRFAAQGRRKADPPRAASIRADCKPL